MENLKTCPTNAQAIADFEAIAYQAFSVKQTSNSSPVTPEDRSIALEDIHAVEAEFWQRRHLVVQDAARSWLWCFRGTTRDRAGQIPMASPVLEGYSFHMEQSGVMKASELAKAPIRIPNLNTPSSASSASPSTPGYFRTPQAGGVRPMQAGGQVNLSAEQQQQQEHYAIYELFMASVISLVSYHVIREHGAIALNYRTFLSYPKNQTYANQEDLGSSEVVGLLTSVSAHWTTAGTLLLCISSVPSPETRRLDEIKEQEQQQDAIGKRLRVAPNGVLARLVSFEGSADSAADDTRTRLLKKRQKTQPADKNAERWKKTVVKWLQTKGFVLPNLEKKEAWVRVRIAQQSQSRTPQPSPSPLDHSKAILWPSILCFYYDTHKTPQSSQPSYRQLGDDQSKAELNLQWYQTPDSSGFHDPIDVAQQWFLEKPERDKANELRRKAQNAEEEATQTKDEVVNLYPSSPLYARTGDLQAVSGVYPTPPDGVIAQGPPVSTSSDPPSIQGPSTIMDRTPSQTANATSTVPVPPGIQALGSHQPTETSPAVPRHLDSQTDYTTRLDTENDDLFGDMDEDVFDGNGVQEADFDFFDEPDGDDMEGLESGPGAKKEEPSINSAAQPSDPPLADGHSVKVEPSDPTPSPDDFEARNASVVDDMNIDAKEEKEHSNSSATQLRDIEENKDVGPTDHSNEDSFRKEPSPPLSPLLIQRKLLPSPKDYAAPPTGRSNLPANRRKQSIFGPLDFNKMMTLSDAKYSDGRFRVSLSEDSKSQPPNGSKADTPSDKALQKDSKRSTMSLKYLPLLSKLTSGGTMSKTDGEHSADVVDMHDSDLEDSTTDGTFSESEGIEDLPVVSEVSSVGPVGSVKRKWRADEVATPASATSFAESTLTSDTHDAPVTLQTDESCLLWFEPTPWDWSLSGLPCPTELVRPNTRKDVALFSPRPASKPSTPNSQLNEAVDTPDEKPMLSAKDSIAIAQILTDQLAGTAIDLLNKEDTLSYESNGLDACISHGSTTGTTDFKATIKTLFPKATDCTVAGFASIQDVLPDLSQSQKGQQRPAPRRMNTSADGSGLPGFVIYPIAAPHIRVRRADTLWDLSPPALSFWEPLGLSPTNAPKNVVPYCIYPDSETLQPCVENFLVNVQLAYEGCRFGSHTRVGSIGDYQDGLVPTTVSSPATTRSAIRALREECIELGKTLAASHSEMRGEVDGQKIDAFVIYMVDPFETPNMLWELCSAFWSLFQAYLQAPSARGEYITKPDIVLQIVPIKYIASFDVPLLLDSHAYFNFAREVYDRCPPSAANEDKTPLSIFSAPAFQLEEGLPRAIHFKLTAEPPQDLLRENSYMHIGYAISYNGLWLTAAWTDSSGKSQAVVSYSLSARSFGEVAREIWHTTIEILQARRVTWRVCIAKAGVMEKEEEHAWMFMATLPSPVTLFIIILAVDTSPSLAFTPPSSSNTAPNNASSTPVSTPQPGVSPDQPGLTPAATPSESTTDPTTDAEARVVDITDESWGIILSHRLHNTNSTVEYRPVLISGLLVKRGECSPTSSNHGPILLGVNMLWIGAQPCARFTQPQSPSPSASSAASPFATTPSAAGTEGVSPGGAPQGQEQRGQQQALFWTHNAQTRGTAENLLKEILGQYRNLGLLGKLRGFRGCRGGVVPWHVAVAEGVVAGLEKCMS